ncbi:MAG: DUF2809 domain-containing protein [Bacteroidales bacterium]|nr:DUF2809 domain-containing protein [Bacteroidales bacterium]
MNRQRLLIILSLIVITPIGFYSKFYEGPAQTWVRDSLGGLFYEIFWCLVFGFILIKVKPIRIALWVFIITCALEFLQLWHPPFLEYFRSTFIGRTILGSSFNLVDFPYYLMGSAFGYFWLYGIRKLTQVETH